MAAREDLREFLRSRRARVDPDDVGLPVDHRPRRVPGLRREEVARLAGVSIDYYTRLEQGRDLNVSAEVLGAITAALQLDDVEAAHLTELARPVRVRRAPARTPRQRVRPGVLALLDSLATPAFVLGRRLDVLASNRMARSLLCDFEALPAPERNHARWVFLDLEARQRYLDWEAVARDNVAALRLQAGRHPNDPELTALIGELTVRSPEFAHWWSQHDVARHRHGSKRYHHPVVGELTVHYEALPLDDDADQVLYLYVAAPDSASAAALAMLDQWSLAHLT